MSGRLFGVIFAKELIDHLRDRRALFSASLGVILGPIMLGFVLGEMASDRRDLEDISIPFAGRELAPELASWLEQQNGVTVAEAPDAPAAAVRANKRLVVVQAEPEFAEDFAQGRPAGVRILFNGNDSSVRGKVGRVRRLLNLYSEQIAQLRLMARGVSPQAVKTLEIEELEVSAGDGRTKALLGLPPLLILLAAFAAGMSAAADSTAGERERGSLEALLANPISPLDAALGKWSAAAVLAMLGALVSLGLNLWILSHSPLYELGVRFRVDAAGIAAMTAVLAPVALFASAFELLIALFARSFKEAQSYLALAVILPTLPMALISFGALQGEGWQMLPVVGQNGALTSLLAGEAPTLAQTLGAGGVTLLLAAVCVAGVVRLLRSERIVFGR